MKEITISENDSAVNDDSFVKTSINPKIIKIKRTTSDDEWFFVKPLKHIINLISNLTARIHNRLSFCIIFLISVLCTLGDIGFQSFLISEFKNGYQLKYIIFAIVGALIFLVITILLIQNIWTRQKVEEFTFCIYIITILIHSAASILFIIKLYPDYFVYNIFLFIISLNSVGIMTILIIVYFGVSVMLIIVGCLMTSQKLAI